MVKHPNGTYIAANVSKESSDSLGSWVKSNNIPNRADPAQYHTTITYSRKGIPDVTNHKFDMPLSAKIKDWKIFPSGDNKKCLVAVVDCPDLEDYHNEIQNEYGATYDYPDYIPHVTVSYDYGDLPAPKEVPDIDIKYDKVKIQPLDPDYTSVEED